MLGPSTLIICKANNVTGTFQFSINSATPVSVAAGSCEPFTVENGHNSVTEEVDTTGATTLSSITVNPSIDTVSSSVTTRTVVVNIPANASVTTTFTNIPVTRLQVCKVAGDSSTSGNSFNFTESVGSTTTASFSLTAALPPAPPNCSTPTPYPPGTAVNIAETAVTGNKVSNITISGGTLSNLNLGAGTVTATLGTSGTTVVTYTDQSQPGNLIVCKQEANSFVSPGPWSFTIKNSGGTVVGSESVTVGNCSTPPLSLPAGNYTVIESFSPPDSVSAVTAVPTNALLSVNLPTGTAVVTVTAGGTSTVTFTNKVPVAKLIVCKVAGDSTTAGKVFPFTESVNGTTTQSFSLTAVQPPAPPNCFGPTAYPAGTPVDLAELVPSGSQVTSIVSSGAGTLGNVNTSAGTSTATLGGDGTTMTVTYTDDLAPGGLKVCKLAANSFVSPGPWSFTITDSMGHAVAGSPVSVTVGNCSNTLALPAGNYTVVESFSSPDSVSTITVSPTTALVSVNLPTGTAVVTVAGGGANTTVTFTNKVPVAHLIVCKVAGDAPTAGKSFPFTESVNGTTTQSFSLTAVQPPTPPNCFGPTDYPAGTGVNLAEQVPSGTQVTSIVGTGGGTLGNINLGAGTATATLGGDGTTTTVTYTDAQTPSGSIKVCKTLAPNSSGLVGTTFTFTVTDNESPAVETVTVPAPALGSTNCVLVSSGVPVGSVATVTEQALPNVALINISVSPSSADAGSTATQAKVTVGATVVSATFTNEALGWVEVCKDAADTVTVGQSFTFTVNGGSPFTVMAGNCSAPIQVPAGTASVNEIQSNPNFYLVSVSTVSVTDPTGARLLTGPTTTPATVVVPYGPVANETTVTFTDAAKLGAFKICTAQTSPGANLAGRAFTYTYSYTVNGVTTTGSVSLFVPLLGSTCSAVIGPIDPVNSDGSPVKVTVTASVPTVPSVDLAGFSYQGGGTLLSSPTLPALFPASATFTVGIGMNILTFTNGATH